ncbi:hypothetical protein [Kitasatospora camelliae]|uniref:Uncharacterized protein n=1 Tax=Kitasatospora camelliae TaxID=3156397 RepID=A0AAU8JQF5_9ACTN
MTAGQDSTAAAERHSPAPATARPDVRNLRSHRNFGIALAAVPLLFLTGVLGILQARSGGLLWGERLFFHPVLQLAATAPVLLLAPALRPRGRDSRWVGAILGTLGTLVLWPPCCSARFT